MMRTFTATATGVTGTKYTRVHNNIPRPNPNSSPNSSPSSSPILKGNKSILSISVNGVKELKAYVDETTKTLAEIRATFESDLKQDAARCDEIPICLGDHEFRAKMCAISHRDVVYAATSLPQMSPFLQSEEAALEALAQIECIRKMLVNNKRQKKTTIRNIRKLITAELKNMHLLPSLLGIGFDKKASVVDAHIRLLSLEDEPASVKGLKKLIEEAKQQHLTVSRNLLKHVNSQIGTMRNLYIPEYIAAAQHTAGAVITHASACRAFLHQTLHLAAIQYCASLWWHALDLNAERESSSNSSNSSNSSECHVIAELVSDSKTKSKSKSPVQSEKMFDISRTAAYMAFVDDRAPIPQIRISVYGNPVKKTGDGNDDNEQYEVPVFYTYDLDQCLAETIFTDEAVESFENAQRVHKHRFSQSR